MANREIKFRAWDTQRGEWSRLTKAVSLEGYPVYIDADDRLHKAAGVELMQYTGLKDKHGVEIYEGDILAFDNGYCDVVRLERSAWRWNRGHNVLGVSWKPEISLSVIGNIYENPELLEAKS